ncbi:MAG: glycine betaine ABC transporter substrate-binding protein [Burkholderiaceae bacterium]
MLRRFAPMLALACTLALAAGAAAQPLRVGSKRFTESYVLAEILARSAAAHTEVRHLPGMGNTAILFEALRQGSIDLYPEYLGTIELEILKREHPGGSLESVNRALAPMGLRASIPLGFENTYALAVRADTAAALDGRSIAALAAHPGLRFGLSHEFLGRADGWPGLKARYALPQRATGLDHGLAYEALEARGIDVLDVYSTDAKIARYGLVVLTDELRYFPRYDALVLHRIDVEERFPRAWQALRALEGRIDAPRMIALNGEVELQGRSFVQAAEGFLRGAGSDAAARPDAGGRNGANTGTGASSAGADAGRPGLWQRLAGDDFSRLCRQHLLLVGASVLAATLVGVPAGVLAAYRRRFGALALGVAGALQTVPSLALLAALIPALGAIGTLPALVALFVYALLPILRNTCVGIDGIAPGIRDAATALGLRTADRIRCVELPLALPVILAGIRTAAVIGVGTATIAAFVGAGGFGERIAIGLALNDHQMLLAGALPAAALALLVEGGFALLERQVRRRTGRGGTP